MLRNYFTIAVRSLLRNKAYTIINLLGLVMGISFSCMLYVYVDNELSYDTFHEKSERTFRVLTVDKRIPENERQHGVSQPVLAQVLKDEYSEVEDMVRLHRFVGQVVFQMDGQSFQERNWYTTDANFFDVFDFEFVAGDRATALSEPSSLVITETMAEKYFGDVNPLGKVIEQTSFGAIKITGVVKDMPENSHLKFDFLFSDVRNDDDWKEYLNNWQEFGAATYIVLRNENDIQALSEKMPDLQQKYMGPMGAVMDVKFQAMEEIYLHSANIENGVEESHGQMAYIIIFSSMGLFILVIACINYINLSTAKAASRAREIGVRKVVGAHKRQLLAQFLTESLMLTLFAMLLSIGVMDIILPYFNEITGTEFDLITGGLKLFIPPLLFFSFVIAVFAGGYPAFYLSQLKPVKALKGEDKGGRSAINLRRALVIFQFVLNIILIASTLVIGRQMNFIQNTNLGFDKENLIVIDINSGNVRHKFQTMKEEFEKIAGVQSVGVSSRVPGEWKNITEVYVKNTNEGGMITDSIQSYFMGFDDSMLETFNIKLKSGKQFANNSQVDSTNIMINEAAVIAFGLTDPLGAKLRINTRRGELFLNIIGVLENFHYQSLHQKIGPMIIGSWNNPIRVIDYFTFKVNGNPLDVIPQATKVHEQFDEYSPIEYHFLDEQLAQFYIAETRVGKIFRMGAMLSILVACLGLLGLASYNIQKRTKELGVRKVLGASELTLFVMLSSAYVKQVALAFVIAAPIAYLIMDRWLNVFEYKISLSFFTFLTAGIIALLIALATIGYRSIKAANSNPLHALRQE